MKKNMINKTSARVLALILFIVFISISLLSDSMKADAYSNLPGIDLLVKQNSASSPLKILEITNDPNDADIGFYVNGQEPFGVTSDGNPIDYKTMLQNCTVSGESDGGKAAREKKVYEYLNEYSPFITKNTDSDFSSFQHIHPD